MLSLKLASRNLPRRKARTTLTIIAVALGVSLLVGINLATASANSEFTSYINRFWGQTDIIVRQGLSLFDNSTVNRVLEVQGVRQVAQRLVLPASLPNTNGTIFELVGLDPATDFEYASFNITGTRQFSPGEAVLSNTLAEKAGVTIGSPFTFQTINGRGDFTAITLRVAGIDYPLRNLGISVYTSLSELQETLGFQRQISHIYISLDDPTTALRARDEIQTNLQSSSFDVSAPKAEAVQRIQGQMAGFQLGLNVMIAVSIVVCSFIVFNTLFMTVNERTYEIGVMRAVGTSRSQIFRTFLAEGLLIGILASTIGVFSGLGVSQLFITIFETNFRLGSLPRPVLTVPIAAIGYSAGLASVLAGSLYPSLSASRTNIIQAIRPGARKEPRIPNLVIGLGSILMLGVGSLQAFRLSPFHVSYLDVVLIPVGLVVLGAIVYARIGKAFCSLFFPLSRPVAQVASRSGRRRLVRTAVSFGMITITLSFVIMLGGIQSGIQTSIEQGLREALGADIILVANQSVPISFASDLTNIPQVTSATPLGPTEIPPLQARGPNGNATIGVLAVDPAHFPEIIAYSFVNSPAPEDIYAQLDRSNETVLVPDGLANRLGVAAGGNMTIPTFSGNIVFKVAGVFTGPILQYVRFGENFVSESVILSFKSQQEYFTNPQQPHRGPVAPIFLVDLRAEDKPRASAVAHDIAARYPRYNLGENSVTLAELLSLVRTTIDRIFSIILLILYFALLIATLGIAATMIMSVNDRRREIGLLRSQGMSSSQIRGLFLGEGVMVGVFGFLLAVPGGLLLLRGATNSTSVAGFWLPFIIPWSAIAQSLALALLAVVAGSLYPAVRASRIEITKALQKV